MWSYAIRAIGTEDYPTLAELDGGGHERAQEELRLGGALFDQRGFLALHGEQAVGYSLSHVADEQGYFTTLVVRPDFHGSRVPADLLLATLQAVFAEVDRCWLTLRMDRLPAGAVLGALRLIGLDNRDLALTPGERIVHCIEKRTVLLASSLVRPSVHSGAGDHSP